MDLQTLTCPSKFCRLLPDRRTHSIHTPSTFPCILSLSHRSRKTERSDSILSWSIHHFLFDTYLRPCLHIDTLADPGWEITACITSRVVLLVAELNRLDYDILYVFRHVSSLLAIWVIVNVPYCRISG